MGIGEWLAWVMVLLLALYGCAQLIRHICLRITRCPSSVYSYQLVVPHGERAVEPLFRCLQAQAAWNDRPAQQTLVLLRTTDPEAQEMINRLAAETPAVTPVTVEELTSLITGIQDV